METSGLRFFRWFPTVFYENIFPRPSPTLASSNPPEGWVFQCFGSTNEGGDPGFQDSSGQKLRFGSWALESWEATQKMNWLVLSDEQMSKRWQFSLLNNEQMSNWVGVKHLPVNIVCWKMSKKNLKFVFFGKRGDG